MRYLPMLLLPLLAACVTPTNDVAPSSEQLIRPGEAVDVPFLPSPGYPPKLGTAQLTKDGAAQVFTTYDYSVGAFDASAWFDSANGISRFTMTGYPGANPDAEVGLLRVFAQLPQGRAAGSAGQNVLVEVWLEPGRNGNKLTSVGHPAMLVVDSFVPDSDSTSGYGNATGRFSATLCPGTGDPAKVTLGPECREVSGSFDTRVQYSP